MDSGEPIIVTMNAAKIVSVVEAQGAGMTLIRRIKAWWVRYRYWHALAKITRDIMREEKPREQG